jgi:hypothetical protein
VGFELTIAVFERAKAFHVLDCAAATVIGNQYNRIFKYIVICLLKTEIVGPEETTVAR